MAVTAGALSKTLIASQTAVLTSAAATGGTGPYTYQWYRSTTSGFTPGAGNILSGQTSLVLNDSGLIAATTYYYVVVATDTGASNATSQSSQLTVLTEPSQNQNQFAQSQTIGVVDLKVGTTNIIACQVDISVTSQIYPGQAVKVVANTQGGILRVAPVSAKSDQAIGFAIFNAKDVQYDSYSNTYYGPVLEVALWGTMIWCYATGAISQGALCCIDPTYVGGVQATGNTATYIGTAIDGAAAAGPIRVLLVPNPSYATA